MKIYITRKAAMADMSYDHLEKVVDMFHTEYHQYVLLVALSACRVSHTHALLLASFILMLLSVVRVAVRYIIICFLSVSTRI